MERSNILPMLFNLTRDIAGFELLFFSNQVFGITGITANKNGSLYILGEEWFELEESNKNFQAIASALYKHLKQLSKAA